MSVNSFDCHFEKQNKKQKQKQKNTKNNNNKKQKNKTKPHPYHLFVTFVTPQPLRAEVKPHGATELWWELWNLLSM